MRAELGEPVAYRLPVGDAELELTSVVGERLALRYEGEIHCAHCGRVTNKSYSQGHCFPCSQRLAACDLCIVKPERCHYHEGTCREPEWGETHCMQPHVVYLSNTSGLKVGITRASQIPTRWIDQGATQALPIVEVSSRRAAGYVEVALARHVADKTDWRAMLRGTATDTDLRAEAERLLNIAGNELAALRASWGEDCIRTVPGAELTTIDYPVLEHPVKPRSLSFDRQPEISGRLLGIKGQYLILDSGVVNVRRHTAYVVSAEA
jgi:hypothetical protein